MNKMEIQSLLKSKGWTMHRRSRISGMYIYASRREGKRIREIYLLPEKKLEQATEEQVLEKIARVEAS